MQVADKKLDGGTGPAVRHVLRANALLSRTTRPEILCIGKSGKREEEKK